MAFSKTEFQTMLKFSALRLSTVGYYLSFCMQEPEYWYGFTKAELVMAMHIITSATMLGFHLDVPQPIGFFMNLLGNDSRVAHAWQDIQDWEWTPPNVQNEDMLWTWWSIGNISLSDLRSLSLQDWLVTGGPIIRQWEAAHPNVWSPSSEMDASSPFFLFLPLSPICHPTDLSRGSKAFGAARWTANAELTQVELEMWVVMQRIVQMDHMWGRDAIADAAVDMGISCPPVEE
ncbi:hypothetical protein HYDPIDRAFT_167503 [Hydnomerulius pinastri MD-312]|uniref:Uncharacterized protein n=1 Tax=Hydnomerulius pinastri MD-312 TaxID=994086 RepID=A0A0C9WB34_9AGAM|nr:hypothetical protein HYDPIDRAFT_167503 [Hydnomerulius pinastri MD-312]